MLYIWQDVCRFILISIITIFHVLFIVVTLDLTILVYWLWRVVALFPPPSKMTSGHLRGFCANGCSLRSVLASPCATKSGSSLWSLRYSSRANVIVTSGYIKSLVDFHSASCSSVASRWVQNWYPDLLGRWEIIFPTLIRFYTFSSISGCSVWCGIASAS